jgi:hypothetical protein
MEKGRRRTLTKVRRGTAQGFERSLSVELTHSGETYADHCFQQLY